MKKDIKIGVDIGGTDVKIGLVNLNDEIIRKDSIPTLSQSGVDDLVKRIGQAIRRILEEEGFSLSDCLKIGIGCPGIIDAKNGVVVYASNLAWDNVSLAKLFQRELGLPTGIENDANCAALGETISGAAKSYHDVIMVTLGTGIGSGIVINGEIMQGGFFGGGEVGHMIVVSGGKPCACGQEGCLETYASATGLITLATAEAEGNQESLLYQMYSENNNTMNGKIPFDAMRQQDEIATKVIRSYIEKLGTGVINLINIFRPEIILFGGGISNQGEYLLDLLRKEIKAKIFAVKKIPATELKIAQLKNDAGIVGAANIKTNVK